MLIFFCMINLLVSVLLILLLLVEPQKEHIRKHVTNIFWYGLLLIHIFDNIDPKAKEGKNMPKAQWACLAETDRK